MKKWVELFRVAAASAAVESCGRARPTWETWYESECRCWIHHLVLRCWECEFPEKHTRNMCTHDAVERVRKRCGGGEHSDQWTMANGKIDAKLVEMPLDGDEQIDIQNSGRFLILLVYLDKPKHLIYICPSAVNVNQIFILLSNSRPPIYLNINPTISRMN